MVTETFSCCSHCGLPIRGGAGAAPLFCCHACRLAAAIVGKSRDGVRNWALLRLGVGTLLAMNVMMISLLLYADSVNQPTIPLFRKVLFGLSAPALAILLPPFFALPSRRSGASLRMEALVAAGSLSAFAVSAVHTWGGSGPVYYDTATMLPVLVTLGRLLEGAAKSGAAELLRSLEALLPETALRVDDGQCREVPVAELRPGDLIRLRPGERIAADGIIVEGTTTVEEGGFTGEPLPRLCRRGDPVTAGTVNGNGSVVIRAERTGPELLLHRIINLVQKAWRSPSEAERLAARAAALFIPAVLVVAVAALCFWFWQGDPGRGWLAALSVAVVACPCTMGIATPLATSLAIARAAKEGVIVRGGAVMEGIARTDLLYVDKTGTLTQGTPTLTKLLLTGDVLGEEELLGCLAALERGTSHPLGKAVIAATQARGIEEGVAAGIVLHPGMGIEGRVTRQGKEGLMSAGNAGPADDWGAEVAGLTAIDVTWDGAPAGRLFFHDPLRPDAAGAVAAVRARGIRCALLSGDRAEAARSVAASVGIERVEAPRTPAQKLQIVSEADSGTSVAMVGDGINDAPALAAADTGIAIGAGTDLARQSGNVVILSSRLGLIPWLIDLSRESRKIVVGNFAWSFIYNALAVAAAAAGLLHPLLAALAMVFSSLTVLGNSLRITAFKSLPDPALSDSESETVTAPPGSTIERERCSSSQSLL
ncbi:heavy metal translocating P-type ATPase [Geomesophilobacter sediminis]|uniref:Heavy metal translocating P-type ATPase n=1 Tax=Geomesophilobacter sediminis TaxID=2798584 RepID=A0A8J7J4Z5_9BACT|nr:cation-translocating P-type ATPase [Geomesophilobacter sediminis]MBJ6726088.1 heavy metal translocating P-type ATPase [Geomesophilobacter sediminis]